MSRSKSATLPLMFRLLLSLSLSKTIMNLFDVLSSRPRFHKFQILLAYDGREYPKPKG
jgi:hypothetical protein